MLSDQDKRLLDKLSLYDIVEHFGIERILGYIDPVHAMVVWGWKTTYQALEKYANHKSE